MPKFSWTPGNYFVLAAALADYQARSQVLFWNGVRTELFTTFHLITWNSNKNLLPNSPSLSSWVKGRKQTRKKEEKFVDSFPETTVQTLCFLGKRMGPGGSARQGSVHAGSCVSWVILTWPIFTFCSPCSIGSQVAIICLLYCRWWSQRFHRGKEVPPPLCCHAGTRLWSHFSFSLNLWCLINRKFCRHKLFFILLITSATSVIFPLMLVFPIFFPKKCFGDK